MVGLVVVLLLPCVYGQGFQSPVAPAWGQFGGQSSLIDQLVSRGWTPPVDVQQGMGLGGAARRRGGFGNRFDFGFSPDQLVPRGVSVRELIPVQNPGAVFDISRDPSAANSFASLPPSVAIPGGLTRGLLNSGLINPALVNPNLGTGLGLIDPTLRGAGFMDPTLQGPGLNVPPFVGGLGLRPPPFPGMVNMGPGGGVVPMDHITPGVIGMSHDRHGIGAVKGAMQENRAIRRKLRQELRARKQIKREEKLITKALGQGGTGGETNGNVVPHGDHFHVDDKIVAVVGSSETHHPSPTTTRGNPAQGLVQGLLMGGLGALLLGR